jgi:flagellar protein FliS
MYEKTAGANSAVRNRYVVDHLGTASNAKILTMCFDRVDRDLATAQAAIERGDYATTNEELGHAQDLLGEMAMMVDTDAWEHAGSLLAVYDYVLRLLAVANLEKNALLVTEAQLLIGEIGEAFRAAAIESVQLPVAQAPSVEERAGEGSVAAAPRFSVQA